MPRRGVAALMKRAASQPAAGLLQHHNLVSVRLCRADHTDRNLVSALGPAFQSDRPFWFADNCTGVSTLYDGRGWPILGWSPSPRPRSDRPQASPPESFSTALRLRGQRRREPGPARFIFRNGRRHDRKRGRPNVPPPIPLRDRAFHRCFTRPASRPRARHLQGSVRSGNNGCAGTFTTRHGTSTTRAASMSSTAPSTPPPIPGRVHRSQSPTCPRPLRALGSGNQRCAYVTYAMQDEAAEDDVAGPGWGSSTPSHRNGHLLRPADHRRRARRAAGVGPSALAPRNFVSSAAKLLVATFGNGE